MNNILNTLKMKISKQGIALLKVIMHGFVLSLTVCLLIMQPLMAQQETKRNLVSVNWLERNLKNADVLVLDASPSKIYNTKHIPGAISYDIFTYGVKEMPITEIEKRFQSRGISPGKKIVIYDQGGTMLATRLFFTLYYYGFPVKNLMILDGGLFKWEEEKMPVTKDITPSQKKGSFSISKLREDTKVELPEFLTASGDPGNNALVEALDADWHFGGFPFFSRSGHIPNAILLPSTDFYNTDKTFKSAEEIQKILTYLGIRPEQNIYTHCGGGIAASVPFFALKFLLDYPSVKLYVGSQLEWISDQRELPFWTYDAPFLMRKTQWLQFWGGQRARMYGISHINILDVRPESVFHQGHLPYALNIPSDTLKINMQNHDNLAKILGQAGVDTSQEVVVVSGAGLTKEAALAYLILEKLGQKKLTVFMDSIATWTKLGFTLIKDSTAAGHQKTNGGLSEPPMIYPVNVNKEVIITDLGGKSSLYPRVLIASGQSVPDKLYDCKVVHIPYTELLNADNTPKAAKDIWEILSKAGVPRYAELICFSNDAGEAAVNCFILRLMGYPDIKVLDL